MRGPLARLRERVGVRVVAGPPKVLFLMRLKVFRSCPLITPKGTR